jgi:Transketolase, C-terminal subunit
MSEIRKAATRDGYGRALVDLGNQYSNMVVLDADLAKATKTIEFKKAFPDRFIDCGIAECNMMGVAAGLASIGKLPFASTFAIFATGRAFEQIRNSIAYPKLNVKVCATHAGISVGEDGASHQAIEDIALMRIIPGMVVINPSDEIEAYAATLAAAKHEGPVYIRYGRSALPVFNTSETYKFEIGKGICLAEGEDVTIIATGLMVSEALNAAEELKNHNISAKVINIHTLKPLDKDIILQAARTTKGIVTCEEHNVIGGLFSAVSETLSYEGISTKILPVAVMDIFGRSGPAEELLNLYGLTSEAIVNKALHLLHKI